MALFRINADGKTYELDKLTLGDARLLKLHYGVVFSDDTNLGDPDMIAGLLYLCLKREHPDWEHQRLVNTIDEIDMTSFDAPEDEPEVPLEAVSGD